MKINKILYYDQTISKNDFFDYLFLHNTSMSFYRSTSFCPRHCPSNGRIKVIIYIQNCK